MRPTALLLAGLLVIGAGVAPLCALGCAGKKAITLQARQVSGDSDEGHRCCFPPENESKGSPENGQPCVGSLHHQAAVAVLVATHSPVPVGWPSGLAVWTVSQPLSSTRLTSARAFEKDHLPLPVFGTALTPLRI